MMRIQNILLSCLYVFLLCFFVKIVTVKPPAAGAPDAVFGISTGDFANLWSAGAITSARHLSTLYTPDLFQAWKAAAFGHPVIDNPWIYPPTILPLGVLASKIPLPAASLLWDFCSLAAIFLLLRRCGLPWAAAALCAASPAELLDLIYGQYGGITGCLAFAGLTLSDARPVLAGLLLGFVSIKPQAGLAAPFALLAQQNRRAMAAAAGMFAVLALLPVLWLGPDCWLWFFTRLSGIARQIADAPFGQGYQLTGISVFWMLRSFGCDIAISYAVQIALALLSVAAVYRLWRRKNTERRALVALTMLLTLFITPYGYSVDLVGYSVALVALAPARGAKMSFLEGVLWLWPGYAPLVTFLTGVLLTPFFILAACVLAWRQLRTA
jgi:hypothetical protein